MKRNCPNCSAPTIEVAKLLVGEIVCANCRSTVGVNRFASLLFSALIVVVTVVTSIMVLAMFGIYAVVVWFIFPIGAISFLRARYSPLEARQQS